MTIVFNDKLEPLEFYRVIDPYTAFQEIDMYIGNILVGVNDSVPAVSDKDMIEAKGFDNKSFRKDPSKKRR